MIYKAFAIWSLMKQKSFPHLIAARAGQFDDVAAGGGDDTGRRFAALLQYSIQKCTMLHL